MTPERSLSGKLLPIHFKPKEDELLSSWICRLALANGMNASSLCSLTLPPRYPTQVIRVEDLDTCVRSDILATLAEKTGTPKERIVATTFPAYEGFLFERWSTRIGRQWTLPVKCLRGKTRYGLQYCPLCLATEEPYYRRAWRLAVITICSNHRVQLLDRCPKCASPISFHKATSNGANFPPSDRMTFCYSCKADLRKIRSKSAPPVSDDEVFFQTGIETALCEGWVELPGMLSAYSLLFFPVLQHLFQFLVAGAPGSVLRKSLERQCGINLPAIEFERKRRELTQLSVGARRGLVNMVRRLLSNWPDDFISYCAADKIRSYHLTWRNGRIPFWYQTVIYGRMRQSLYAPSKEEIESAVSYLKKLRSRYRRWPQPYPKEMKVISEFLNTASRLKRKIRKTRGVSVIRRGDKKMRPKPMSETLWKEVEFIISSGSGPLKLESGVRRKLLNGILYVLYTGCPWTAMPAKFGSYESARGMYYYWKHIGLFEEVWRLCSDLYV
jgi:hypothetical protein